MKQLEYVAHCQYYNIPSYSLQYDVNHEHNMLTNFIPHDRVTFTTRTFFPPVYRFAYFVLSSNQNLIFGTIILTMILDYVSLVVILDMFTRDRLSRPYLSYEILSVCFFWPSRFSVHVFWVSGAR